MNGLTRLLRALCIWRWPEPMTTMVIYPETRQRLTAEQWRQTAYSLSGRLTDLQQYCQARGIGRPGDDVVEAIIGECDRLRSALDAASCYKSGDPPVDDRGSHA